MKEGIELAVKSKKSGLPHDRKYHILCQRANEHTDRPDYFTTQPGVRQGSMIGSEILGVRF